MLDQRAAGTVLLNVHTYLGPRAAPRRDDGGGGGRGRGPFEVDCFHATPIGIMLNAKKITGDRASRPPPPPPSASAHAATWL